MKLKCTVVSHIGLLVIFTISCGGTNFGGKAPTPPASKKSDNSDNSISTQSGSVEKTNGESNADAEKVSKDSTAVVENSDQTNQTGGTSSDPKEYTDEFTVSATTSLLDMVFVVNNSLSMIDEAAQVTANLSSFLSAMSTQANLKVALISKKASGLLTTGVTLSNAANYIQISDMDVFSNDSLAMVAASICNAASSGRAASGKYKICDVETNVLRNYDAIKGKLSSGFFRSGAKSVVVSVSDNQANDVDDKNFLTMIAASTKPTVYSFQGFTSSLGCIIFGRGTAYEALAAATGGQTFDVCAKSWSPYFTTLNTSLTALLKKQFVLKSATAGKILDVQVNGKAIDATLYQLSANTIILNDSVAKDTKTVAVHYLAK